MSLEPPTPSTCSGWSIARHILQEEGVRGMFRGLTSTWAREVPGYFFFFGGYSASRRLLTPSGGHHEDLSNSSICLELPE